MSLSSAAFFLLSLQFFTQPNYLPIAGWCYLGMGIAWALAVLSNHYEHKYEIRSSSAIYAFYVLSLATSLYTIRTLFGLESAEGSAYLTLIISSSFLIIGFIVEAWPRGSTKVQKASRVGLYEKANLGSRLIFSFYYPFIKIGLTRGLTQEDLLGQLPKEMEIEVAYEKLESAWKARLRKRKSAQETPSLFVTILISSWPVLIPVLLSRIAIVLFSYTLPVLLKELLGYLETYESKPLSYGITLAICMFISSLMASLLSTYNRYQMILIGVKTRAGLIAMIYRWTMLAGVTVMLVLIPIQTWQARVIKRMQREKLKAMDQRIHMTTDVLASMKIIKLYGWGSAFMDRILEIREQELEALRKMGVVQAFMSIIFISSSLIISLITFSVYALWGGPDFTPGQLTPQTVFVSMTLFAMLKGPIASLSDVTTSTIGVLVATKRIQNFLLREEVNDEDILRFDNLPRDQSEPVISFKDATFSWTGPIEGEARILDKKNLLLAGRDCSSQVSIPPALQSINLSICRGSLAAIVGRVGQGKSSMLSALISDMYKIHGRVQVSGKIAYVPQQAWIINKTLRENILFGNEYDEEKYNRVLYSCGLGPDLAILPGGDMTEIGERGINLSGGQKQRVSLARAAYCEADIYLMDDPLSAVDAHVDKHLWDNVIGPKAENGTYSDLMTSKKAFYRLIKEYSIQERRKSQSGPSEIKKRKECEGAGAETAAVISEITSEDGAIMTDSTEETVAKQKPMDEKKNTNAQLITVEVLKQDAAGFGIVLKYAKAVSRMPSTDKPLVEILD
ncbi:Canalicular multispecific organic anion transporter 2 [Entomortierella beljakovae]|nr:Canalicular multispecific organic anion transporter 2 [Entomortierella beljakovae]